MNFPGCAEPVLRWIGARLTFLLERILPKKEYRDVRLSALTHQRIVNISCETNPCMAQEIVLGNALELRVGANHGGSGEATLQSIR
jgi:hypothetical protein